MEVKELKARDSNVDLTLTITDKGQIREFQKFGKQGRVCTCKAKDSTGEIQLTLWNEDIDKIEVGDKVALKKGYVKEWQGELQISTGKFGSLEVLEKASDTITEDEKQESKALNGESSDEGEHILTEDEITEEEVLDE